MYCNECGEQVDEEVNRALRFLTGRVGIRGSELLDELVEALEVGLDGSEAFDRAFFRTLRFEPLAMVDAVKHWQSCRNYR